VLISVSAYPFACRMYVSACACPFECLQKSIRFADAIWNGESCPFEKGDFLQASFFPKQNAGGFRSLRRATRALPLTCQLLKKLDQNFNTGARRMRSTLIGYVCGNTVKRSVTYAGRNPLGAVTHEKPPRGVNCECWVSHAAALRRKSAAGTARPEGNARGGSPPAARMLF